LVIIAFWMNCTAPSVYQSALEYALEFGIVFKGARRLAQLIGFEEQGNTLPRKLDRVPTLLL
jgi:hypothetical protein